MITNTIIPIVTQWEITVLFYCPFWGPTITNNFHDILHVALTTVNLGTTAFRNNDWLFSYLKAVYA